MKMKISINIKTILLIIVLAFGVIQAGAQTTYYVSLSASGSDNGSSAATPMSFTQIQSTLSSLAIGENSVVQVYFAPGIYTMSSRLTFSTSSSARGYTVTFDKTPNTSGDVIFDGGGSSGSGINQFVRLPHSASSSYPSNLILQNVTIRHFYNNTTSDVRLFDYYEGYQTLTLENVIIDHCGFGATTLSAVHRMMYIADNHKFYMKNSTIKNSRYYYMIDKRYYDIMEISGSSFINNNIYNRLIYIENASSNGCLIYNNTFSGNIVRSGGDGVCIYMGGTIGQIRVFNNTIYNSGDLHVSSSSGRVAINNLLAGTSLISAASTAIANSVFSRNTSGYLGNIYYNATGNSTGMDITSAFDLQFNTTLSTSTEPGKQVHTLDDIYSSTPVILGQGGTLANLSSEVGISLTKDQLGNLRSNTYPISLGAIDYRRNYVIPTSIVTILFNSNETPGLPQPKEIDLKELVAEIPESADINQASFQFVDNSLKYGSLSSITSDKKTTFTPSTPGGKPIGVNDVDTFSFKVTQTIGGVSQEVTGLVKVVIVDIARAPGYIDPTDYTQTCFDYMGKVSFTSAYRFRTTHATAYNLVGFSIPLIADLNNDGYPEIIAFGKNETSASSHYQYIRIFNGQTGTLISSLQTASAEFTHSGWHPSPAPAVVVDADRDGIVEFIMAFPPGGGGTSGYAGKVVSFALTPTGIPLGSSYRLDHKKTFPVSYGNDLTIDNASLATPQVCDLDGDGVPELLVYNKIYDAVTGELLFTIDENYMGRNPNAWYNYDRYQAFPYIYDLDGDGIYDIAAGGKLYKITKPGGSWKVEVIKLSSTDDPGDGFTGVADINGDGSPDIVTIRQITRTDTGNILVTVWNPGFSNGTANPYVLAKKTVTITYRTGSEGSNSYVYIGDINGVEYQGKRLPEIAVLSGRVQFATSEVHPSIQGLTGTTTTGAGAIFALTYDETATDVTQSLKYSFFLEHQDTSDNTGFTMFDFDNDGIMEICYRDRQTLRIIKPTKPYVSNSETSSSVILFKESVHSETGFEYPVIADIDNDASAEMVVLGNSSLGGYHGYVYALGNGTGDKFTPARPVWNQFVYDPFKINDDLTTPVGPARDRLMFKYKHEVKDEDGNVEKTISNYQPFNATVNQAPYFTTLENGTGQLDNFEPIIFLTEAYIVAENSAEIAKRPKIEISGSNAYISITIGNKATAKTDISINTPITIYENEISTITGSFVKTVRLGTYTGSPIKAGQEVRIQIPISNAYSVYYVRLGDDSGNPAGTAWESWRFGTNNEGEGAGTSVSNPPADAERGIGRARRAYRDCDWTDQAVKVSLIALNHDAVTVQEFGSVLVDIFDNDEININDSQNPFPTQKADFQMGSQYIRGTGPVAGTLTFTGNNIIYIHNGTIPPNNIDTFSYAFKYTPTGSGVERTFSANVYIYIMQPETGGFGACYGNSFTTRLKESPAGIRFIWWDENGALVDPTTTDSLTISFGNITTAKTYTVKPLLTTWNNDRIDFVPGKLTISPAGTSTSNATMKWTGQIDTKWNDPRNWVEIKNGVETSVSFIPTNCVDVIIPSGLKNYPILTDAASCGRITMKDRAMIAGINWLTYTDAQVEVKLKPSERDRFIMWSAPLKNMYSGDYHFKNGGAPYWGDVYMNFFQADNPDGDPQGAAAKGNHFTATFKNLGVELIEGQAFNLKLVATSTNRDSAFIFPKTDDFYTATDDTRYPQTGSFNRADGGRFISDDVIAAGNKIRLRGEMSTSDYIQVVNPFMAYLDIRNFLNGNPELENAVKIWKGGTSTQPNLTPGNLITILPDKTNGNRYIIDNAEQWFDSETNTEEYIAPLQSFFVKKASSGMLATVNMNPTWTTVNTGDYVLRTDAKETNTLRIKATLNNSSNATVLFYHPEATPNYNKNEDAYMLFHAGAGIEVYSFSPANDPLSVNMSSDFQSRKTRLGIRAKEAGQATFDFSGMETFGYNVYLIDHTLNDKRVNIQQNSTYTFSIAKQSASDKVIELNDRFTLEMQYTGIGVGNEEIGTKEISISSKDGYINVQASSPATSIQVYNTSGALVYSSNAKSDYYRIHVDSQQTYIVKVKINNEYTVEKVFVK